MTARNYVDNAPTTTVSGAINNSATSFAVASLAGFPTNFPYTATLGLGTSSAEVILVTAATGSTVTVTRNYNGLGAFSHPNAETFNHTANAIDYSEANAHVNASSGVHGVTGSVVGTGGTQTLTNKTLTAPVISTISNTGTLTLPTSTDTLVGRATTDTLTNKTINGATVDATSTLDGTAVSSLPRGRVAGGSATASQSVLTTVLAVTGMADMSFTVVSGRRYRVTLNVCMTGANSPVVGLTLKDGGGSAPTSASTTVRVGNFTPGATSTPQVVVWELVGGTDLTAGVHHLGVFCSRSSGTGVTASLDGASTTPSLCQIQDIGV